MCTLNFNTFGKELDASFDLVDDGKEVFVKRGNKTYVLSLIDSDPRPEFNMTVTPEILSLIEEAKEEQRQGDTVTVRSRKELHDYLNSL